MGHQVAASSDMMHTQRAWWTVFACWSRWTWWSFLLLNGSIIARWTLWYTRKRSLRVAIHNDVVHHDPKQRCRVYLRSSLARWTGLAGIAFGANVAGFAVFSKAAFSNNKYIVIILCF